MSGELAILALMGCFVCYGAKQCNDGVEEYSPVYSSMRYRVVHVKSKIFFFQICFIRTTHILVAFSSNYPPSVKLFDVMLGQ